MTQNQLDDGRVGTRIENYCEFWQKDVKKEDQVDSDVRLENYTEVVNGAARRALRAPCHPGSSLPPLSIQATTTAQRTSMSTAGASRSISRASTRASRSWRPSLATSTTSPRR